MFCGTELGLYVSFNGGEAWQPFQRNLPVCPITDLRIHKGDLIAATSGRSFWILDDLTLVRQYETAPKGAAFLYNPKDAYRTSSSSALDGNGDDDNTIRLGRGGFWGTNPASGVVFYYQMPEKKDSAAVLTLEILDDKGQVVRSLSSKFDSKFVQYPGGPQAEPTLTTKSGLNRFVWNLRCATLPGIQNVFIEGGYGGRIVAPGVYKARLKMGDVEKTVSFNVLADPRLSFTASDYAEQQQMQIDVENAIRDMHNAVNLMRQTKKQINDLIDVLGDKPEMKPVIEKGKSIVTKIVEWEEQIIQPKSQSNDDVINFENKLSADYIFLKGNLDVNTPSVTKGEKQRLSELNALWQQRQIERGALQKSVTDFNNQCRQMNLEKIVVPAAVNK